MEADLSAEHINFLKSNRWECMSSDERRTLFAESLWVSTDIRDFRAYKGIFDRISAEESFRAIKKLVHLEMYSKVPERTVLVANKRMGKYALMTIDTPSEDIAARPAPLLIEGIETGEFRPIIRTRKFSDLARMIYSE